MLTESVLMDVLAERRRQSQLHGVQTLPDGTGDPASRITRDVAQMLCDKATASGRLTWRDILREEVMEAFAESERDKLRVELVQIAAVAVQWVEAIDRESEKHLQHEAGDREPG